MKDWDTITAEELNELHKTMADLQIAESYNVTVGKVRYKRKKFGITFKNQFYDDFVHEHSDLFQQINADSKQRLVETDIEVLSKALTHYLFRNGPVEDMHANGQLSQNDMKTLNQFMVNRIAGLIYKMNHGNWLQIELLLGYLKLYGANWDPVVPETSAFEDSWDIYKERVKDEICGNEKRGS